MAISLPEPRPGDGLQEYRLGAIEQQLDAMSPLLTQHINPYGRFELDLEARLELDV